MGFIRTLNKNKINKENFEAFARQNQPIYYFIIAETIDNGYNDLPLKIRA